MSYEILSAGCVENVGDHMFCYWISNMEDYLVMTIMVTASSTKISTDIFDRIGQSYTIVHTKTTTRWESPVGNIMMTYQTFVSLSAVCMDIIM